MKRILQLIGLATVGCIILAVIAFVVVGGNGDDDTEGAISQVEATDIRPTATVQPQATATEQRVAGLGETLERDGYALTAMQVADPAQPGSLYEAEEGKRLVAVEIIVGCVSADKFSANPLDATLVDSDGFTYDVSLASLEADQLPVVDLAPGEKVRGWVGFQIPEGSEPARIKYQFDILPDVTLSVGLQ